MANNIYSENEFQELKEDFLVEANEHLQNVIDGLLVIEQKYNDYELVNSIFRSIHSIKGGAMYLNFEKIVDTAHVMETLLDKIRSFEIIVNKSVIDYLFRGTNILQDLLRELSSDEPCTSDYTIYVGELDKVEIIPNGLKHDVESIDFNDHSEIQYLNDKIVDVDSGDSEDYEDRDIRKIVIFEIGNQSFGFDVSHIREIVKVTDVTPVPYVGKEIKGLMNLRGEIITLVDLKVKLDLMNQDDGHNRVVILNKDKYQLGITVDAVHEVLEIKEEEIKPPVAINNFKVDFIYGIVDTDDNFILLLDIEKILH